jgi:hypothetical protein
MKVETGTEPRNSFSGNICFEFSVLCRCSDAEKSFSFPHVEELQQKEGKSSIIGSQLPTYSTLVSAVAARGRILGL